MITFFLSAADAGAGAAGFGAPASPALAAAAAEAVGILKSGSSESFCGSALHTTVGKKKEKNIKRDRVVISKNPKESVVIDI